MARVRSNKLVSRRRDAAQLVDELATWTTTRAATTANLIDALTASAVLDWVAPRLTASAETFEASWLRVVAHPVGRGWAIANVELRLPTGVARQPVLAARLRALIAAGADPRAGLTIARHVLSQRLPTDAQTSELVEELLMLCRDDRVYELFATATAERDGAVPAMVKRVLAAPSLAITEGR